MSNTSKFITNGTQNKHVSRFVKCLDDLSKADFLSPPNGVFGSEAKIICGNVTIKSSDLDIELDVPFDDNMEANEAQIIVYNLSDTTIKNIKRKSEISIEAGYKNDTGVIFSGTVLKVHTKSVGSDRATTIDCVDDTKTKSVENVTFAAGTKASAILNWLLKKTNTPIAVFKVRRDHTYKEKVTVDGDLMENIKKYAEVCGISVFVSKGKIYARHIKEGDNLNFILSSDTGLIDTVELFEEEQTAEDFKETVVGYKGKCLLQHRLAPAAIITLKSKVINGTFRVRSGRHIFNPDEAVTEFEMI